MGKGNKIFAALLALSALGIPGAARAQSAFAQGDMVVSFGIGAGKTKDGADLDDKSRATFTQKLAAEWCVTDGLLNGNASVGFGVAFTNAYGDKFNQIVAGTYDYYYNSVTQHYHQNDNNRWVTTSTSNKIHREGVGTAEADFWREDMALMVTGSFHYNFIPNLDVYVQVGLGPGLITRHKSNYSHESGFSSVNQGSTIDTSIKKTQWSVSARYDDLDHVVWDDGLKSKKLGISAAALAGARYYLTDKWGVNLELGMVSGIFGGSRKSEIEVNGKKQKVKIDYGNDLNIFNIGVSYKF